MAIPALVFLAINSGYLENTAGWAIPAATDIAFALGILVLLGPRVPVALKALLLAIAVIDDIGAITIIALFYTGEINTTYLLMGGAVFIAMLVVRRMRVASAIPYVLLAILMWAFILKSGVHATLAGIFGFAWFAVKTGMASLPDKVNWLQIHGLSLFAAIGFTMSLLIGNLAFASPEQVDAVKLGVLSGSTVAAIAGFFLLRSALPSEEEARAMAEPEGEAQPAE